MLVGINSKQADKLSSFFFDIAKGFVLGIAGLSISDVGISLYFRFINVLIGIIVIYFCVKIGLELIKND